MARRSQSVESEPRRERAEHRPPACVPDVPGSLAQAVLTVQQAAGNAAAAALIARAPLQRDTGPAKVDDKPKTGGAYTMTMSKVGVFPIESFSMASGRADRERPSDVNVTKRQDEFSPELLRLWRDGTTIQTVEVVMPSATLVLANAHISSYVVSGTETPTDSFTLTAQSITFEQPEEEEATGP